MLRTVGEVVEVLMVEIIDLKRHAEILRGYHLPYPLRITMADPVPGIAQPRLADTSAFFT
jgi:hypothetical protein